MALLLVLKSSRLL